MVLPPKSYASRNVLMIDGAVYHQIGKPIRITSCSAIGASQSASSGRDDGSSISTLLRLFLSIQSRSACVYGTFGRISYRSAPIASASTDAAFSVTPLALNHATNVLLIPVSSFVHLTFLRAVCGCLPAQTHRQTAPDRSLRPVSSPPAVLA